MLFDSQYTVSTTPPAEAAALVGVSGAFYIWHLCSYLSIRNYLHDPCQGYQEDLVLCSVCFGASFLTSVNPS